ncbi:hypothetical protein LSAT2_030428 [Lamellibrachia satsuma]|nr:hypothetical protein LSAT2_030428 [Lamellibrachia satsuma]
MYWKAQVNFRNVRRVMIATIRKKFKRIRNWVHSIDRAEVLTTPPPRPHHHYAHTTTTPTPPPRSHHHRAHTTTAPTPPPRPHHHHAHTTTTPTPPPRPHHHRAHTTTAPTPPPRPHHHHAHTTTLTPPPRPHHHRAHTTTPPPPRPHHHRAHTTTTPTPPPRPHHHRAHTTTAPTPPPRPHHHRAHTTLHTTFTSVQRGQISETNSVNGDITYCPHTRMHKGRVVVNVLSCYDNNRSAVTVTFKQAVKLFAVVTYTQRDIYDWLSRVSGHTFLELNQNCSVETMRASVVLLFAFLALAFVAAYAAVDEEADDPSLSVNEDSDEASIDVARVKRAYKKAPPKLNAGAKDLKPKGRSYGWRGCHARYWGHVVCYWTGFGIKCYASPKRYGGCQVWIWKKNGWNLCCAEGPKGARCYCYRNSKNVKCYAP